MYENAESYENLTLDARECIILFELQHAILAYSSCYDTILQIVYFAFHFAKDFTTEKKYHKQLSRCKWFEEVPKKDKKTGTTIVEKRGVKVWLGEISSDKANTLYDKLVVFYGAGIRGKVNKYANSIKHKGGISIARLNTYIPKIIRIKRPFMIKKNISFQPLFKDVEKFDPKVLYPEEIDFNECFSMLVEQNLEIYNFTEFLYEFMGLSNFDKKSIFASQFTLPFYYDKNDTE